MITEKEIQAAAKEYADKDYNVLGPPHDELDKQCHSEIMQHFIDGLSSPLAKRMWGGGHIPESIYADLRTHVIAIEGKMREANYNAVLTLLGPLLQKLENYRES